MQARQLQELLSSPGWGVFSRIYQEVVNEAALDVDELEGVQLYRAQGRKEALKTVNARINDFLLLLKEEEEEKSDGEKEEG